MSFTFNWPRFSDQFHYDAIQMLNTALNKGNKPPVIADKIEVVELEMGTQPPELEIRDIGDLTVDQFRGIFRLTYSGDAHLVLKTKVQANPLNHKQSEIHVMAGSRGMLAAKQPLAVPMLLRLSHFKLNSYVVLVVSKQKGITLVFKTDPLQHVDINSTFDSIAVIQKFIQREIETQLRQMFREDLPGIIHRLSQQWIKAKVEAPYLPKRPLAPPPRPSEAKSIPETFPSRPHDAHSVASAPVRRRPPSVSGMSVASTGRGRFVSSKVTPSVVPPPPSNHHESSHSSDPEPHDFTYGLRPEGLPSKSLFKGFSSLFTPNKGLADLAEDPSENGDVDDEDDEDDAETSYSVVDWDGDGSGPVADSLFGIAHEHHHQQQNVTEYETIPAVGGGTITRPRVVHSSSQVQAFPDAPGGNGGGRGVATPGILTRSQSFNNITPPRSGFATPGTHRPASMYGALGRSMTPDLLEARMRASRSQANGSGLRSGFTLGEPHGAGFEDDHSHLQRRTMPIPRPSKASQGRRMSLASSTTFDSTSTATVYQDDTSEFHTGLSPPDSYYHPSHSHRPHSSNSSHKSHHPHHPHSAFDHDPEYDNETDYDQSYAPDYDHAHYHPHHSNLSNPNLIPAYQQASSELSTTPTSSGFVHPTNTNGLGSGGGGSGSASSTPNLGLLTSFSSDRAVSGAVRPTLLNTAIHQLSTLSHSNHTLSPYTRSLNHFTVRSVPPRSTATGAISRSGSGSGSTGSGSGVGEGERAAETPSAGAGLAGATAATTAGIIGRSTKLGGAGAGGGGRVAGSATMSMFVASREKQPVKAKRKRIYRLGGGGGDGKQSEGQDAPSSRSVSASRPGYGYDETPTPTAQSHLAPRDPYDAYRGSQYGRHHYHQQRHPQYPQQQMHPGLGLGYPQTPTKRGKFKGAPLAPGSSGAVGPAMVSPDRLPSEFDVSDMDRYFRSNEDLVGDGGGEMK